MRVKTVGISPALLLIAVVLLIARSLTVSTRPASCCDGWWGAAVQIEMLLVEASKSNWQAVAPCSCATRMSRAAVDSRLVVFG